MINDIDISQPAPPKVVYSVNRESIRAGRGVVRAEPRAWIIANGKPWAIECKGGATRMISECYASAKLAAQEAQRVLYQETELEAVRFLQIKKRLQASSSKLDQFVREVVA